MARSKAVASIRIDPAQIQAIARVLAAFDRRAARAAIRKGVNEATKLVSAEAKARVPVRTKQLKRSIGRKVRSYKDGRFVVGVVGPRRHGFKIEINGKTVDPVRYAKFVEFGRGPVAVKKAKLLYDAISGTAFGQSVGPAAARPFLRPALARSAARAVGILKANLLAEIEKFRAGVVAAARRR